MHVTVSAVPDPKPNLAVCTVGRTEFVRKIRDLDVVLTGRNRIGGVCFRSVRSFRRLRAALRVGYFQLKIVADPSITTGPPALFGTILRFDSRRKLAGKLPEVTSKVVPDRNSLEHDAVIPSSRRIRQRYLQSGRQGRLRTGGENQQPSVCGHASRESILRGDKLGKIRVADALQFGAVKQAAAQFVNGFL